MEKVAEEVKFRREAKKLQPKTQQVGKSSGTKFFKSVWQKDAKCIQYMEKVAEWIISTKRNIADWYLQAKITAIGKGSGRD